MANELYPGATTNQWFAKTYPGRIFSEIEKGCLHTTETPSWPGYGSGRTAPNVTAFPDVKSKSLLWRQHFPINMSSRALENRIGGVETNTDNIVQVELIGTCDPTKHRTMFYWPDAPDWALDGVADFLAWMHLKWGLKLVTPELWLPYGPSPLRPGISPASYGASPARMSMKTFSNYRGVLGHQHVPENSHGDPYLDINKVLSLAEQKVSHTVTKEEKMATLDKKTIDEIVDRAGTDAASKTWNRFLVPDDGVPNTAFKDALGQILDNTQGTNATVLRLLGMYTEQQSQISRLRNAVEVLRELLSNK